MGKKCLSSNENLSRVKGCSELEKYKGDEVVLNEEIVQV